MTRLTDTKNMEMYLDKFERHMKTFKVHVNHWSANPHALLDEQSLEYIARLPNAKVSDYKALLPSHLMYNGINANWYRTQWRNRAISSTESRQDPFKRLKLIFTKWVKDAVSIDSVWTWLSWRVDSRCYPK